MMRRDAPPRPVHRRSATRDDDRAEVLERAATEMAAHGYHGMSMRDLARVTGRGLASFYVLFGSKEDILFELQRRAFERLVAGAESAVAAETDPDARVLAFVENHIRFFVEQPDVMRVLVQEASALPPDRRAVIRALKQRYFAIGEGLVREVMAPSSDGMDAERATYCVFGMLNWVFGWYEPARHGSAEVLARTIAGVALRGIAVPAPERPRRDGPGVRHRKGEGR